MIFSELYGVYYNTVARILRTAADHALSREELCSIVTESAFGESILSIVPALEEERWQLLLPDGTTPLKNVPTMPLTTLQKRWLKAISLDPRVRLFPDALPELPGIEPLFTPEDICVFDRCADGDPYEDPEYIARFRLILDAIRNRTPLYIEALDRHGNRFSVKAMPEYLEYSEKDDKFRLVNSGTRYGAVLNLGRILAAAPCRGVFTPARPRPERAGTRMVELVAEERRKTPERLLLHFAHFRKEAEKTEDGLCRVRIWYDRNDETEMVIRVLSFGPTVRVTRPKSFADLIRARLRDQKFCGQ